VNGGFFFATNVIIVVTHDPLHELSLMLSALVRFLMSLFLAKEGCNVSLETSFLHIQYSCACFGFPADRLWEQFYAFYFRPGNIEYVDLENRQCGGLAGHR
jgi:hypothetical protein